MQAKINLVKDCETAKQKLDRPARLRTILQSKLLVKDLLSCLSGKCLDVLGNRIWVEIISVPGHSAPQSVLLFFIKFFSWK